MLHNIYSENVVNCILKRRLIVVGPFSRNKSHMCEFIQTFPDEQTQPTPNVEIGSFSMDFMSCSWWLPCPATNSTTRSIPLVKPYLRYFKPKFLLIRKLIIFQGLPLVLEELEENSH